MARTNVQTGGNRFGALILALAGLLMTVQSFATEIEHSAPNSVPSTQIERAARVALESCEADIARFCANVTPGESRLLACIQAYADQVTPACAESLGNWEGPDIERDFRTTLSFPTLENRKLGAPKLGDQGERVIWDHPLPFLAQQVVDLGFDLPNPFGVAIIPVWIQQDLVLQDLFIGFNGPPDTEIDFVDFGTPQVENVALQLKLDAWIFPFLNLFATVGVLEGDANIPLTIQGADLFPTLCNIAPNSPQCVRTFSAVAQPGYSGENISLGINLAMGWDRFFFTLPITYAWTDINIIDTTVNALNITPRIGMTGELGERGTIAVFLGATYLDADVDIEDTVVFETPGGPEGDFTSFSFRINQRNKDQWNYLLGFNWDLNKSWSVNAEAGVGGSRQNFIAGVTYRF